MTSPDAARVTIDPAARGWKALLDHGIRRRDAHADPARRHLGLTTDRPIIMTGHQLVAWHPGILSKLLAAASFAKRTNAQVAWVGVDQDSDIASDIRYPVVGADGGLGVETLRLRPPNVADVAAASLPAVNPEPFTPKTETLPGVRAGLDSILAAWQRHASAASAALQAQSALRDLVIPHAGEAQSILATSLARTSAFGFILDKLRADARRCVDQYNAAVAANPAAHMSPLRIDANAIELPLWILAPNQPRRRAFLSDLATADPATLAPRALLMTGLLRWAACDLFIHGTGGAIYDTITERWLGEWLGVLLAPTVMVTADLYLPLQPPGITPRAAADAHWKAHRAEHDPAIIGDSATATAKRSLVEKIAQRRAAGERPVDDYRAMHAVLADYRTRHAHTLTELKSTARQLSVAVESSAIATDRTWAFPLYAPDAIAGLKAAIDEQFA